MTEPILQKPTDDDQAERTPERVDADSGVNEAPPSTLTWQDVWGTLHQQSVGGAVRHAWRSLGEMASDRRRAWWLLVLILLLGAVLRFTGLNWDENQHLHPDERFLTMVENSLSWPKTLGQYFDTANNSLNPYNFGHGSFVYGLFPVVVAKFLGQISSHTGYDGVFLAGRAMAGMLDLLCVLLVFLIGRRLYSSRHGLVGALLYALTALGIQQSHFFTVDTSTVFYVTLALYFAVRVAQGEGWGSILMLGVTFGMAVAAKISVLSFALVIGLALLVRTFARQADARTHKPAQPGSDEPLVDARSRLGRLRLSFRIEADPDDTTSTTSGRIWLGLVGVAFKLLLVLIVAGLTFRVAQPQAFMGPGFFGLKINPQWLSDMKSAANMASGEIDYPPSHQWADRTPVLFMLKNMVLWGVGVPMGVTVWITWALMAFALFKKHRWVHLLPWTWFTFTFFYQSVQFVKAMRYIFPIYPTMALMAGFGLVCLWDWAKERAGKWQGKAIARWLQPVARGIAVLVVVGTTFWAVAFAGIYTRPVSRAAASRWIYANIPQGSVITYEEWDDALPLNIDGHLNSGSYKIITMKPYWEDREAAKLEEMVSWIDQADYIILSSNRLYGSIPRLSERYPMTTRYYEALFSGELGFDLVAEFTSRPTFLGIEINDDNAEESWTVYDHPKVSIFRKSTSYSVDKVRSILGSVETERIVALSPKQQDAAPNQLMLTDEELTAQQEGGTWSDIFDTDSLSNRAPTLTWLLLVTYLGIVAFPLGFVVFRRLRDRGYVLSKTLGLLLLGYLSWILPSLKVLPYSRWTILGMLALLTLVGAGVAWVQRRALLDYIRARWRLLVVNEALFLAFFALFWLIRWGNPDLWHPAMGGEKPMDFAYLNAIIKSTYFPPYDPWFAGGYINYYYYGLVNVATLCKLTGIVPEVAYNLAIPTLFAMTAMGACCVTFNLIGARKKAACKACAEAGAAWESGAPDEEAGWWPRALRYGVLGALLVAVAGNLGEVRLLLSGLADLGSNVQFTSNIPGLATVVKALSGLWAVLAKGAKLQFRTEWWYWNASRIMGNGEINEFPFFTFLYADLHAHLTALPFTTLVLGLATSLVVKPVAALARLARDYKAGSETGAPVVAEVGVSTAGAPCGEAEKAGLETGAPVVAEMGVSAAGAPCEEAEKAGLETGAPRVGRVKGWLSGALSWWHGLDWPLLTQIAVLGLAVGELWCNNSWDFPTYMLVAVAALAFRVYADSKRIDQATVVRFAWQALAVVALSIAFYQPFHAHFGTAYTSVELWKGERTSLGDYLVIHGLVLFVLASYLLTRAFGRGQYLGAESRNGIARAMRLFVARADRGRRARHLYRLLVRRQTVGYELAWMGLVVLGVLLFAFLVMKKGVLLVGVPLLVLGVALTLERRICARERLVRLLVTLGMALTLGVEYVVIKGDIGRMNTVFKFYLQVWVMWGIAAAVALAYLMPRRVHWPTGWRRTWSTVLTLLLIGVALYPVYATLGKVNDRWSSSQPNGLDGLEYMTTAQYSDNNVLMTLDNDYEAIQWIRENIEGSPVIAEANAGLYRWGNRISINTGLPTIIGWDWHEKQQRAAVSGTVVDWRLQDVQELYTTTDLDATREILKRYNVSYIYVGELEQAYYAGAGLDKFMSMVGTDLEIVYLEGPVTIYRVLSTSEVAQALGEPLRPFPDAQASRYSSGLGRAEPGAPASTASEILADLREERQVSPGTILVGTAANAFADVSLERQVSPGTSLVGTAANALANLSDWFDRHWVGTTVLADEPEKEPSSNRTDTETTTPALMLDEPVDQLPVVNDRGWNTLAANNTPIAILCWWLVLELIGLACWPVAARVFPRFPDAGYGLAKGLGLLIVSYLVWIGASVHLVPNGPLAAWGAVLLLAIASALLWGRRGESLGKGLRARLVVLEELLFTGAFLAFVWVRILNPDLWQPWFGGEKMMEIAILNALNKSAYLPPYDPYFSGGYLNYYYYGQFIAVVLVKLVGVTPEVAFNLAVPTFFALTVSHTFVVGCNLARRIGWHGKRGAGAMRARLGSGAPEGMDLSRPVPDASGVLEAGDAGLETGAPRGAALESGAPGEVLAPVMADLGVSSPGERTSAGLETGAPGGAALESGAPQAEHRTLRRGVWGGVWAVVCVALMGNLSGIIQVFELFARAGGATFAGDQVSWADLSRLLPGIWSVIRGQVELGSFDYWYRGTRIIPYTINEFPFFSFLFADLHPHMIGIPFTVLAVAFLLAFLLDEETDRRGMALRWLLLAVTVGALGVINTWDLPTALGLLGVVMLYRGYRRNRWRGLATELVNVMMTTMGALLLYAPFYSHYQAQNLGVGLVSSDSRSPLIYFLVIWGAYLFLVASLLVSCLARGLRTGGWGRRLVGVVALFAGGALSVALAYMSQPLLSLLAALVAMAAVALLWGTAASPETFLQRLLVLTGLALLLGVELLYVKDFLSGGDWSRMNTVFKFYIQAWVLLGLAVGAALPGLWRRVGHRRFWGPVWRMCCVLLLAGSLVYTVVAVPVRVNERFPSDWPARDTLDGTAYMTTGVYYWPDGDSAIDLSYDREAIVWLWENVEGTPVLAEAAESYYRAGALRVSSYTGLPTIVGMHESEQRPGIEVSPREIDVATLYNTTDATKLFTVLARYRVRYIYVGQLERLIYNAAGVDKFADLAEQGLLERVYANERVEIYRVLQDWDA